MNFWKGTAASAGVFAISTMGTAVFADVTPEQVWSDWKGYMAGFGYELKSTESMSGGRLTVSDIRMGIELPEDQGRFTMQIGEMSFEDNGDGTVSVQIPPVMPMVIEAINDEATVVKATLDYATKGFSMTVSGDPENMTYNYTAAEMRMALAEVTANGEPAQIDAAELTMENITGTTSMQLGDLRRVEQKMNSGETRYTFDFTDPATGENAKINGRVDSLLFGGVSDLPLEADAQDVAGMIAAGFGFDGNFSSKGGSGVFEFTENGRATQIETGSASSELIVAMDGGGLTYSGKAADAVMKMAGGEIPFPVEIAMATTGFKLMVPVEKDDEAQDFAFGLTLGDFTMSEMIWGIFDPAGQLPRDPATIALDLTGKAKLFVNLMDPEEMARVEEGGEAPGELEMLSLNSMRISAAGAELTGNGAFTFDNSDTTTFDGMPAPEGAVDLKLVGANGLLDKLVAMGLLPEDQVMGLRMMMGLFAVPGLGEDTLTSTIEVNDQGHVLANGQRLK